MRNQGTCTVGTLCLQINCFVQKLFYGWVDTQRSHSKIQYSLKRNANDWGTSLKSNAKYLFITIIENVAQLLYFRSLVLYEVKVVIHAAKTVADAFFVLPNLSLGFNIEKNVCPIF